MSNNTDGIATRRSQMYEINREAKKDIKNKFGLGKCKLSNVCTVSEKIRQWDLTDWKSVDDTSMDYLGIVQHCSLHDGFEMYLFIKKDTKLYAELAAGGTLVLHYDATG